MIERINNNAYKLDLPGEYNVSATFNISDLSPFDAGTDSRSNPFEEGGDDVIQATDTSPHKDPLMIKGGPMTRLQTKRANEAIDKLVQETMSKTMFVSSKESSSMLEANRDDEWINRIQAANKNCEIPTFTAVTFRFTTVNQLSRP